jgi:hypothetical protein
MSLLNTYSIFSGCIPVGIVSARQRPDQEKHPLLGPPSLTAPMPLPPSGPLVGLAGRYPPPTPHPGLRIRIRLIRIRIQMIRFQGFHDQKLKNIYSFFFFFFFFDKKLHFTFP